MASITAPQNRNIRTLRDDPVIVLGMHHSGTSILSRILHENGVFMQANMHHYESKFFTVQINDRLVLGDEAAWADNPIMPVDEVLSHTEAVRAAVMKKGWRKYREAGYDGVSRWGFKDPRTCVLLPLYRQIFPAAQYIHIVRNADDVATSLAENNKKGIGKNRDRAFWKALWQQYVDRARHYGQESGDYLEFTYEAFCTGPVETMREAFAFLGLAFTDATEDFLKEKIYTHRINIS
mgnify:CR=1 FL=1